MFPQITSFLARFPHWSLLEWGGLALNLVILFFLLGHALVWLAGRTQGLRDGIAEELLAPSAWLLLTLPGPRASLRVLYSNCNGLWLFQLRREVARRLEKRGWQPTADSAGAIYHIIRGEWECCAAIGEDAVGPLYTATRSADWRTSVPAVGALARIAGPLATEVLIRNLARDHTDIPAAAALAERG
jgi:hypothetical protein